MKTRNFVLPPALALIATFALLALLVHRVGDSREPVAGSPYSWVLGPGAPELERAVLSRIERALSLLNDSERPAAERLRGYREQLAEAEQLTLSELRAHPGRSRALARLAALRWELEQPLPQAEQQELLRIVQLASEMAPTRPRTQFELGRLLLKMGRPDEAEAYLARAVSLDPARSEEAVGLLWNNLFGPDEMLAALPDSAPVLAALGRPYLSSGMPLAYAGLVESFLGRPGTEPTPALLRAYGDACFRAGDAARLRDRLAGVGELASPGAEAERLKQRARAHLVLGDASTAVDEARLACDTDPSHPRHPEFLGDLLIDTGRGDDAVAAYRDSLSLVARGSGDPRTRARLYRKIGQAYETIRDFDRAFDAFRVALELDPEEPHARRQLDEMRGAAGLR